MSVIPTIIYSCMLGMTLLALLEVSSKPRNRQTLYLGGLLGLLLVHILGELHIHSGAYQYWPALAGLQFPIRVLLGPALYFYAWATMSPENTPSKRLVIVAVLGPVLVTVAMVPFLMISPEQKLALADPATRDPELWRIAVSTCLFATLIFIVFTGAFLMASLKLHHEHRNQLMERFAAIEQRSLDWFRHVLMLWGAAWFLYAVEFALSAFQLYWFGSGIALPILEAVILMAFTHRALNQPVLDEADKRKTVQDTQVRVATLGTGKMRVIAEKLEHAMKVQQLYLEEDLSLKRLSESTGVSENHISETLSQHLGTNFFHFINGFRIEDALKQLADKQKLVSTIAYEVGFNSKSTFNSAFRKAVGTTPSAYRNRLQQH